MSDPIAGRSILDADAVRALLTGEKILEFLQ